MWAYLLKNRSLQWVLCGLLLAFLFYKFTYITLLLPTEGTFFFNILHQLTECKQWVISTVVLLIFLLQLLLVTIFTKNNEIFQKKSNLPILLFLILFAISLKNSTITTIFFTNTLFLLLINLNNEGASRYNTHNFYIGAIISIAVLLDFTTLAILLYALVSIFLGQFSRIKSFIQLILGYITPLFFIFVYYFLTDKTPLFATHIEATFHNYLSIFDLHLFTMDKIGLLVLLVMTLFLTLITRILFTNKLIIVRQQLGGFHIFLISVLICLLFSSVLYPHNMQYSMLYLPLILAIYLENIRMKYVGELISLIIFAALWF